MFELQYASTNQSLNNKKQSKQDYGNEIDDELFFLNGLL